MRLKLLLKERNMSVYQCARISGIPYTTLLELVSGKTQIRKCTAETVYKLAGALNMGMEELLKDSIIEEEVLSDRSDFEIFKSNVCHMVKDKGDMDFIIETLEGDIITVYWEKKWYPECFYLLAMLDYLSRENHLPLCENYNNIRNYKLPEPLYPRDITLTSRLDASLDIREQIWNEAIPEFLRFNIVESEVRNVC